MQNEQLINYIQQCVTQGMQPVDIRIKLLQSGWSAVPVDAALAQLGYANTGNGMASSDPRRVMKGVLWILSPYILFVIIALLQFVARFVFTTATSTDVALDPETEITAANDSIAVVLINIFSLLAGIVAVILIPVGFIVGIIKITKK